MPKLCTFSWIKHGMKLLDEFLNFLMEHSDDPRISVTKKVKYGYKHYIIELQIDENPDNTKSVPLRGYRISDTLEFHIDNRNVCIEILYRSATQNIIIEDKDLVEKWSQIAEDHLNRDMEQKTKSVIEEALNECHNKSLLRDYKMKKIFNESTIQSRRSRKNK